MFQKIGWRSIKKHSAFLTYRAESVLTAPNDVFLKYLRSHSDLFYNSWKRRIYR